MKLVLILFVVIALPITMAGANTCTFGYEAIVDIYTRFDDFRKAKRFDGAIDVPTVQKYLHHRNGKDGGVVSITANNDFMIECYNIQNDDVNEIVTINGTFYIKSGALIKYRRDSENIFSFNDLKTGKKFKLNLADLDDVPTDFEEDIQESYRVVVLKLILMRYILFRNRHFLIENFEDVSLFEYTPFPGGFYVRFVDNLDGNLLSVFLRSKNGTQIHGIFQCGTQSQKYKILDGNLVIDGEPCC